MKVTLERVTNVATIAACFFVVGHIAVTQYRAYANRPAPPYGAGDVIADTSGLALSKASLTLMIGTASSCRFCTESMDYYGRLAAMSQ